MSAFDQMLVETPCCVAVCDEVGTNLLAKIGHKKASTHEIGIKGFLLELWSREDGMVPDITNRHARMKGVKGPVRFIIERPSFTILSASTPATFWESIPSAAIKDGFINRWLLCKSAIRGATQNVSREQRQEVPASIVVKLQALVPRMGHGNMDGLLGRVYEFETSAEDLARVAHWLKWEDDEVRLRAEALEEQVLVDSGKAIPRRRLCWVEYSNMPSGSPHCTPSHSEVHMPTFG